jgi:hypothetical protein
VIRVYRQERRARVLALLIAAPAIVGALGFTAIEGYRVVSPEAPLFGPAPATTIVEAIQRGNQGVEDAYAFIAAGQDANQPIAVTDEELTGGRRVMVSPLMLAVAARNRNVVQMLLNFGARLDLPQNRLAVCLATALQSDAIVSILERDGGIKAATTPCPEGLAGAEAPLLAVGD